MLKFEDGELTILRIISNGVYTHCVPSRTVKEAKSPLDF